VALNAKGWSEKEAERRTGIRQGHINDIVNAKRDLLREDLRNFSAAGVSADFLLGTVSEVVPVGSTRTKRELENDVADEVRRRVIGSADDPFGGSAWNFWIRLDRLLDPVVAQVRAEVNELAAHWQRRETLRSAMFSAHFVIEAARKATNALAEKEAQEHFESLRQLILSIEPATSIVEVRLEDPDSVVGLEGVVPWDSTLLNDFADARAERDNSERDSTARAGAGSTLR